MAAADDVNNHLQAITNIFENLEAKKQLGNLKASAGGHLSQLKVLCKCRGILFNNETLLQEFRIYVQCFEDE